MRQLALLGAAFDSIDVGERTLLTRLLDKLGPDMLVLADRGFPSYELYTAAVGKGAQLAWRVSDSFTLPVKKRLDDGTYLSELRGKRRGQRFTIYADRWQVEILSRLVKADLRTPGGVCAPARPRAYARSCGHCCACTRRCER